MIELPDAIRLYGRTYKVEQMPDPSKNSWNGLLDHTKAKIYVDADVDVELLLHVMLHECCHVFQIEEVMPVEEQTCNAMAHFIYQMLYDNPWIAKAFCGEEEE